MIIKNIIGEIVFRLWLWLGSKLWQFVDIKRYCDNPKIVEGVTFSNSKKYIDAVGEVET